MSKFSKDIQGLLEHIGGKENIVSVSHCATRLRFVLKDTSKADIKAIEKLPSVKGSFTQGGQFQVIIGNEVSTFYNEMIKMADIKESTKAETKEAGLQNVNWFQRLIGYLGEIFAPLIPAIVVGGLILGFRNIIGDLKLFEGGTKSLTELSQFCRY